MRKIRTFDLHTMKAGALSLQHEEQDYAVYRMTKDGFHYRGVWNDGEVYTEDDVRIPLQSTVGDVVSFPKGTPFANVIGSTGDPIPEVHSWIKLYENKTEILAPGCCVGETYDFLNDPFELNHGETIVGGHVLINTILPSKVLPGLTPYILPICNIHNSHKIKYTRNGRSFFRSGDGFYMRLDKETPALTLNNYFKRQALVELK